VAALTSSNASQTIPDADDPHVLALPPTDLLFVVPRPSLPSQNQSHCADIVDVHEARTAKYGQNEREEVEGGCTEEDEWAVLCTRRSAA
jgi:hypothetical protein